MRFENLLAGDTVFVVFDPFKDARPMRPGTYPVIEVTKTLGYFSLDQSKEEATGNLAFSLETGLSYSDQDVIGLTYTAYINEEQWLELQQK